MRIASSKSWTRILVSTSSGDNPCTTSDTKRRFYFRSRSLISPTFRFLVTHKNFDLYVNRTTINSNQKWEEEKQLYEYFKRQTDEISHEKTSSWLRKENLKKETESLQIAAQNNDIRTNYVKTKIDRTQ